ncbi:roadblock/LC7 domain-containing protein [Streptomyces sp. NPDC092903]|uniref:roadblock/LC7 domain-containing protein n=1 Tax=Streptomyces sp. NPDC092903 TaxID=3366017 RepID=UPI0037FBDC2B
MQSEDANDLSWLLERFATDVAGVTNVLLLSTDGFVIARAHMREEDAERCSAALCGIAALCEAFGNALGVSASEGMRSTKQVLIEKDSYSVFVTRVGRGLPEGHLRRGADPSTVGTILGVIVEPKADIGGVAYAATQLNSSLAEHLCTAARGSDAVAPGR